MKEPLSKTRGGTKSLNRPRIYIMNYTGFYEKTGLAQLVEHGPFKPVVAGSSPAFGSYFF